MHDLHERPAVTTVPVDDAWLADALAVKRGPVWSPLMPFDVPTPPRLPNPYAPPVFTVTQPPEAKAFLANLMAKRDRAYAENAAHYARHQHERGAWDRKVEANARVTERYSVDIEAIENRTVLAVAQAIEDTYRAVIDELRSLYPND